MFLFVDHYEPRGSEDLEAWTRRYQGVAAPFVDADGHHPRHTWFYDGDEGRVLDGLGALCGRGGGEVEIHLHHAHDTAGGLRAKLEARKRAYAEGGALSVDAEGRSVFGFIHGKWSLDNSRGEKHCGVNNELIVLRESGCYADFTFPAWGRMQPRMRNSIYYATDEPDRPKSYDHGRRVEVGGEASGDLMIIEGPGRLSGVPERLAAVPGLAWLCDRLWLTCAVDGHLPPTPRRIDRWVRAGVAVENRPEWVFVKVHTHGARPENYTAYFERSAAVLHGHLAGRYNDGERWKLHYVTAREAYNIVKAAEAGETGDPGTYRDYVFARPENATG
jgi:hypothetical protein